MEKWEQEFDEKFKGASDFCSCYEGDLHDLWPDAQKELKAFIRAAIEDAEKEAASRAIEEMNERNA